MSLSARTLTGNLFNELLYHPVQLCTFTPFMQHLAPHLHCEDFTLASFKRCLTICFCPLFHYSRLFSFFFFFLNLTFSPWTWHTCVCYSCINNLDSLVWRFFLLFVLLSPVLGNSFPQWPAWLLEPPLLYRFHWLLTPHNPIDQEDPDNGWVKSVILFSPRNLKQNFPGGWCSLGWISFENE